MKPNDVLMYMAMQAEAEGLIQQLDLREVQGAERGLPDALPMRVWLGEHHGKTIRLITAGQSPRHQVDLVGTEPAAVGLQAALHAFPADCVLNAGTAGGFKQRGAAIADLYLGHGAVYYHDHRIPLPGFDALGHGEYPSAGSTELAHAIGAKLGTLSSGCSLDCNEQDWQRIRAVEADCKDMEAAALAWVCDLYGVPFVALKSITDWVDEPHPTAEQFLANLEHACDALTQGIVRLLEEL